MFFQAKIVTLAAAGVLAATASIAAVATAGNKPSHRRWDRILKANVTSQGWVDYKRLQGRDSAELKAYLRELAGANPERLGDKNDAKAFWINAYNAVCIQTIIDHGVPGSVPHAVIFGTNIFTERKYKIAGKVRSLDDIEHGILRKRFKDNRVHAAVVCGASSCPRLRPEAYAGERLDRQLDAEVRSWITNERDKSGKRKNYLDRKQRVYYVSKIFSWYQDDFGGSEKGVLEFLRKHSMAADRKFMDTTPVTVQYLTYDWSSNRQ